MKFDERLSELVAECGLPNSKIGEAVGVSDSHIGAMCAGKKRLGKVDTAIALADFFGVSLDYLLCRSDERGASIKKEPAQPPVSGRARELLGYFADLDEYDQGRVVGMAQTLKDEASKKGGRKSSPAAGTKAG